MPSTYEGTQGTPSTLQTRASGHDKIPSPGWFRAGWSGVRIGGSIRLNPTIKATGKCHKKGHKLTSHRVFRNKQLWEFISKNFWDYVYTSALDLWVPLGRVNHPRRSLDFRGSTHLCIYNAYKLLSSYTWTLSLESFLKNWRTLLNFLIISYCNLKKQTYN